MYKWRFWSEDDIRFLRENYKNMTHKEMAEKLGRTELTVSKRCRKIGLLKSPTRRKKNEDYEWRADEVEFLKTNYRTMTIKEIAEELGRSFYSVEGKKSALALRKMGSRFDEKHFCRWCGVELNSNTNWRREKYHTRTYLCDDCRNRIKDKVRTARTRSRP